MIEEENFETYLSISPKKFEIFLFDKKNLKSLYKDKLELENKIEHLTSLNETKLYYGLLRCLEEDPYNRYYLWI